jgi:predicted amidohydrolase YtcJ
LTIKPLLIAAAATCMALAIGCNSVKPEQAADAIYTGGEIVTVNDAQPTVEAVAVKDGKILDVGTRAEVEKTHKGVSTQMIDLGGKTLLPGFIDGHSHFMFALDMPTQANVSGPPVGPVKNIPDMIAALKELQQRLNIQKG